MTWFRVTKLGGTVVLVNSSNIRAVGPKEGGGAVLEWQTSATPSPLTEVRESVEYIEAILRGLPPPHPGAFSLAELEQAQDMINGGRQ